MPSDNPLDAEREKLEATDHHGLRRWLRRSRVALAGLLAILATGGNAIFPTGPTASAAGGGEPGSGPPSGLLVATLSNGGDGDGDGDGDGGGDGDGDGDSDGDGDGDGDD